MKTKHSKSTLILTLSMLAMALIVSSICVNLTSAQIFDPTLIVNDSAGDFNPETHEEPLVLNGKVY